MKKVLLITGASSEVGVSLLKKIVHSYDFIYLQYRTMNEDLEAVVDTLEKGKFLLLKADLLNKEDISVMIQKIMVNGIIPNHIVHLPAQNAYNKQFHKDNLEKYSDGWQISVYSILTILKACIPSMAKQKYGRIVFMLSSCTLDMPPRYQGSYIVTKYALLGLMKSLSVEYMEKGITVNGVSPDMMETKFLSDVPELIIKKSAEESPLNRNILIDEVLPVIQYMLSEEGAAMTGQNIGITGGK